MSLSDGLKNKKVFQFEGQRQLKISNPEMAKDEKVEDRMHLW
jgi:hypothetical protein